MKIYYEQIKEEGLALETDFSFEDGTDSYDSVSFEGLVDKAGEAYMLTGVMKVKFSCPCDRCLEPIHLEFTEDVALSLSPLGEYPEPSGESEEGLTDEEAGMYVTPKDHFEPNEFLREEALLLAPIKRLCKEDCKGICPECGAALNNEQCSCGGAIDPRWAALKEKKK